MQVLAWNVQEAFPWQGSRDRIQRQVEFIDENQPDVLLLNEVTAGKRELWRDSLREVGYSEVVDSLDWAKTLGNSNIPPHEDINHVNGNLTALHDDFRGENLTRQSPSIREGAWEHAEQKDWDTNFPEKILPATFELETTEIEVWNVRAVPGNDWGTEKVKILETTYNRIRKAAEPPVLLAGDFNAPQDELEDGTIVPWRSDDDSELSERWTTAERNLLNGLTEIGMVDVFRQIHGYEGVGVVETSHDTFRFDHLIASEALNPNDCYYDHDGFECSDHAPIIGNFRV
ncbi:hypothetical protein LPA44_17165 [Halobacterium sp. KA-4]|uniref:endonuclease/exonuclease/phosphatase family protein n=1 Tax=Halobacterium sp. KA-4 TaxID=2896367 RepID=UPI001E5A86DF|nr:endonuclease/exonuclease/phosphatase family protein [Halobacterium sp. KA-4]MCD2201595.1 hypothetical protein [Halobacterium sp. KA-4]